MSIAIIAIYPGGATGRLVVDAITQESGQDRATITEHPVEQGSNVSDHIRPEAEKLKFEIVITNTPLGADPVPGWAELALHALKDWQQNGAILAFDTTTGHVSNVAIESISWTRDAKTGGKPNATGGLHISLGVKQIRIVQNKLTKVAISKSPNVGAKTKTGKVATQDVEVEDGFNKMGLGLKLPPGATGPTVGVSGALTGGQ